MCVPRPGSSTVKVTYKASGEFENVAFTQIDQRMRSADSGSAADDHDDNAGSRPRRARRSSRAAVNYKETSDNTSSGQDSGGEEGSEEEGSSASHRRRPRSKGAKRAKRAKRAQHHRSARSSRSAVTYEESSEEPESAEEDSAEDFRDAAPSRTRPPKAAKRKRKRLRQASGGAAGQRRSKVAKARGEWWECVCRSCACAVLMAPKAIGRWHSWHLQYRRRVVIETGRCSWVLGRCCEERRVARSFCVQVGCERCGHHRWQWFSPPGAAAQWGEGPWPALEQPGRPRREQHRERH